MGLRIIALAALVVGCFSPEGHAIADEIATRNPAMVERAFFWVDWLEGDKLFVYLKPEVSRSEAEAAYCDLTAPARSLPAIQVTVFLDAGGGDMVWRDDCSGDADRSCR